MIGTKVLINFLKDFFCTNHGKQHTQPYLFGERKNKTNYLKKVKDTLQWQETGVPSGCRSYATISWMGRQQAETGTPPLNASHWVLPLIYDWKLQQIIQQCTKLGDKGGDFHICYTVGKSCSGMVMHLVFLTTTLENSLIEIPDALPIKMAGWQFVRER